MSFDQNQLYYTSRAVVLSHPIKPILDNLKCGVTIVNVEGVCIYMNKAQLEHDGFTEHTVIGQHIASLYIQHELTPIPTLECLITGKPILRKSNWYKTFNNLLASSINDFFPLFDNGKKDGVILFTNWLDISSITQKQSTIAQDVKTISENFYTFDSMLGKSVLLLAAIEEAKMAATTSSSVMIWGESGTGKEIFAQAIHTHSSRSQGKFIAINCAAIPETLLEGLLFGTTKGAYTDATDQMGLLEQANGGTLLLDELNSMPLSLQNKLLRVLQEKSVRRLGSQVEISFDVRIISILNVNPLHALESGILRHDLFYRLAVVGISVPPLRKRDDDVLLLARECIDRSEFSLQPCSIAISDEVINILQSYNWPGNVRELIHVMEGSLALIGEKKVITVDCLPKHFLELYKSYTIKNAGINPRNQEQTFHCSEQRYIPEQNTQNRQLDNTYFDYHDIGYNECIPLKDCLERYEEKCIRNVLKTTGWNVAKAARILNITNAGLHYKIRVLNIHQEA